MRRSRGRLARPANARVALASLGLTMGAVAAVATAPVAAAHDVVINSNPEDGSTVSEFPHTIELEFSAIPLDTFNRVAVSNEDTGEILYQGEPELNQQMVTITLPEDLDPGDGNYLVGFQITSSDGHATRGGTTFSVDTGENDSAPTTDTVSENAQSSENDALSSSEGSSGPMMFIGGGIVLLAVIIGGILMFSKRKENSQ